MKIKIHNGEARINSVRSLKSTDDTIVLFADFSIRDMAFESHGTSGSDCWRFSFEPWNNATDLTSYIEITLDDSWQNLKAGVMMGRYSATIILTKIVKEDMAEVYAS